MSLQRDAEELDMRRGEDSDGAGENLDDSRWGEIGERDREGGRG